MEGRRFVLLVAIVVVALSSSACSSSVDFSTPGRAPPAADDFVVNVDGTPRGFGKAKLSGGWTSLSGMHLDGPLIVAEIPEMAIFAVIRLPTTASTVSCLELPNGIVLSTSSPVEHANTSYVTADWSATECSIVVSRIDATATKGAEGSFSGTLVRGKDEVGGKTIEGPKSLKVTGTFIVSAAP